MLESFKAQTMKDFEWIVVDQLYDERKGYFRNMNLPFHVKHVPARPNVWHDVGLCGVCTQYNKGIIYADGELLYFVGEGYMFIPEFCERLWARYRQGYIPFAWYFYDMSFASKDLLREQNFPDSWRKTYLEIIGETNDPYRSGYNICGYTGEHVVFGHRPIHAFKGKDVWDYHAPWEWWFGCSSTPLDAMLKINGFDQRFDGDRMLSDCDVGSRLQMAGYNKFAIFKELFSIRLLTDTNTWNPKLPKYAPSIKCNLPLIWWSRIRNCFKANDHMFTDEDIRWMKEEYCGKQCAVREQCKKDCPWQYPFEHKEWPGHLSKKIWFDYWRTHQVQINLNEERNKRLSGDIKYQEGTFI